MIIYAIVRAVKARQEWMSFYARRDVAERRRDDLNKRLGHNMIPYTVITLPVIE